MHYRVNYKHLILSGLLSVALLESVQVTNIQAAEVATPPVETAVVEEAATVDTPALAEEMPLVADTPAVEETAELAETTPLETESVEGDVSIEETEEAVATTEEVVEAEAEISEEVVEETAEETITNAEYLPADNEELAVEQNAASYDAGAPFDEGGTEIVKYNPKTQFTYSVNGYETALDIIENKDDEMNLINRVYLGDFGIEASDLTSVAVHPDGEYIAITAPAVEKTDNGILAFFDAMGEYMNQLTVGALPDMVTFSKDGQYALVANEGEPNDDYTVNPAGSVSVIELDKPVAELTNDDVRNVEVDASVLPEEVRNLGPDEADYPLNYEPEYIVVDENSEYAYVSFQEASAIGKLDIANGEWTAITNMGYKDHSIPGNGLDASDRDDAINIANWPVLGMYHPDGIDVFDVAGESYIITANEGDSQDYDGYSEEVRVKDLAKDGLIDLKAEHYAGYTQEELNALVENGLFDDDQLGRLTVTTAHPFIDENGMHNALVAFGGRSFSIIRASDMTMVFDSGDQFEQIIAAELPAYFNQDIEGETWDDVSMDGRSDNKGAETESVIIGNVNNQQYAFVASERTGGFFIYNVSKPDAPAFVDYIYDPSLTNISPEGLEFVPAEISPNGQAMLIVAHELSGTVTTFNLVSLLAEDQEEVVMPGENNGTSDLEGDSSETEGQAPISPSNESGTDQGDMNATAAPISTGHQQAKTQSKKAVQAVFADEAAIDQAGLPATGYQENTMLAAIALALVSVGSFLMKPFKRTDA